MIFFSVFKYNMHFIITGEYSHVYCVLYIELLFNIIQIRPSSAGPAYEHGPLFTNMINPSMLTNYMPIERWNEITYPFPNFNDVTVEVWELISNLSPHFIMDVITYPCPLPLWLQIFQHQNDTEPSRGTAPNENFSAYFINCWLYRIILVDHIKPPATIKKIRVSLGI